MPGTDCFSYSLEYSRFGVVIDIMPYPDIKSPESRNFMPLCLKRFVSPLIDQYGPHKTRSVWASQNKNYCSRNSSDIVQI